MTSNDPPPNHREINDGFTGHLNHDPEMVGILKQKRQALENLYPVEIRIDLFHYADKMWNKWRKCNENESIKTSLIHGFQSLPVEEKVKVIGNFHSLNAYERDNVMELITSGPYSGFAHDFKINGKDYFVFMETEEASVVQGASYGAKLCYGSGGIRSCVKDSKVVGQIQLFGARRPECVDKILEEKNNLLGIVNAGHEHLKAYDLHVNDYGSFLDVKLDIDPGDSMGAAAAGGMADSIRHELSRIAESKSSRGMPSNYCGRLVETEMKVPIELLSRKSDSEQWDCCEVLEGILFLDRYAKCDVDRALTNNKGIMNGVIGVAQSVAQDTRAIAAANTTYEPLSFWSADDNYLYGRSTMLIPCGVVGGEIRSNPNAEFVLKRILRVEHANELAQIMASVGLANNLAALSMNATIGLKEGHDPHRK